MFPQVQYQNLVNELIKNIIIFSEDIFPSDGGPVYEKYLSRDSLELEADVGDAPNQEDFDSEHTASEDGRAKRVLVLVGNKFVMIGNLNHKRTGQSLTSSLRIGLKIFFIGLDKGIYLSSYNAGVIELIIPLL